MADRRARRYHEEGPSAGGQAPVPPGLPSWQRAALLLLRSWRGLGEHGGEIAAIVLLAFALVTFLALFNLTRGTVVDALADGLTAWLGWGAPVVPLSALGIGAALLARAFGRVLIVNWWRVMSAEVAVLTALGLLQWATKASLAEALAGRAGGIVGWSLALIVRDRLEQRTGLALAALFAIFFAYAVGLTPSTVIRLLSRLQVRLRAEEAEEPPATVTVVTSPVSKPESARTLKLDRPREKIKYAKRFTVEPHQDSRPGRRKKRDTRLPPLDLLDATGPGKASETDINRNAAIIEKTLSDFGVPARVIDFKTGPSVTQFALEPGFVERPGADGRVRKHKVRVSQISALANDLALALSASPIRIEAPVPGHSYVGIEVPNRKTALVGVRGVMESEEFARINSPLAIALGRDVSGTPMAADLVGMPHLLIAGTTGSGKSVCIVSIITCLVMNNTPEDLRIIMIDPKTVELVRFNGLPHLLGKVEVELDRIVGTLRWAMREMDRRFKLFEAVEARDINNYNRKVKRGGERLPRIVIVVDELADLMMLAPDETEKTLVRLAQMARATGLHLVVATQRPSTDIVTGLIKANFPARISFAVASGVDSRVILDGPGADTLLGRGDMLYLSAEAAGPVRMQGCYVGDREVEKVVEFWREQAAAQAEEEGADEEAAPGRPPAAPWDDMLAREAVIEDKDSQIEEAIAIVKQYGTASASLLQRKMRIGYPRAARLMDELYEMGIIGRSQQGGKTRELLIEQDDDPIGRRAKIIGGDDGED